MAKWLVIAVCVFLLASTACRSADNEATTGEWALLEFCEEALDIYIAREAMIDELYHSQYLASLERDYVYLLNRALSACDLWLLEPE